MKKRNFFKAAHRDKAERPIIQALRSAGASVYAVSGKDIPDLLVGFRGVTILLEVKSRILSEEKGRKARVRETRISPGQQAFSDAWRGGPACFVYDPAEALRAIGAPFVVEVEGLRWLAENGAFICEHCWFPENGLHAKNCPTRKALAKPPKVQSAYRAAKTLEEALPKRIGPSAVGDYVGDTPKSSLRTSRGVEGELQPLKVKRTPTKTERKPCGCGGSRVDCVCGGTGFITVKHMPLRTGDILR